MQRLRWVAAIGSIFLLGYACGSGGGGAMVDAGTRLLELTGGSLAGQLAKAGAPPISAGFGIAERVPEDGTRHFTLTVASENREAKADAAALYALMDGHGAIGEVWGGNILAFAHTDMTSGAVQGLEIDVGNLGTTADVPVTGLNVFAIGQRPASVAIGILNGLAEGPGGFHDGIVFRSNAPGVAVTDTLMRVHNRFGAVRAGIDLTAAEFSGAALATPGFAVDAAGGVISEPLATGAVAYACVDAVGALFASASPCVPAS